MRGFDFLPTGSILTKIAYKHMGWFLCNLLNWTPYYTVINYGQVQNFVSTLLYQGHPWSKNI